MRDVANYARCIMALSDNVDKEKRFKFGQILVEMYTTHNLPHRTQVMTTFQNEIPLKIQQGTVLDFRINTNFACSKR